MIHAARCAWRLAMEFAHALSSATREDSRYFEKLNSQDDFAELGAGFKIGVRGGGFRERENVVDDGL